MARSAQAWRDAATSLTTLTTDADNAVRTTLTSIEGETARAATEHWTTFVEPDAGHLTSTVRGMTEAADRLDHAAQQVGAAKVEIVRNLVSLAQNSDAAHTAAAAGHPTALAGLQTAVDGTTANVSNIESNLISAVQPASGVTMSAVEPLVDANPGAHEPTPLVENVTAQAEQATGHATGVVEDVSGRAAGLVEGSGAHAAGVVEETGGRAAGLVEGTGRQADAVAQGVAGLGDGQGPHGSLGHGPGDRLHHVADAAIGQVPGAFPDAGNPEVTGPVTIGGPPDFADDRPTPPSGVTVQAGFDPGAAVPAQLPASAPPVSGVPAPGQPAPGPTPGVTPGVPGVNPGVTGGGPTGGAAPAPGAAVPGQRPPDRPIPMRPADPIAPGDNRPKAGPAPSQPPAKPVHPPVSGPPARPGFVPVHDPGQPGAGKPVAGPVKPGTGPGDPGQPNGPVHPGAPEKPRPVVRERDEALALFWVHMFPIGHMPVAADRPGRQVAAPREELDYAAGLRFEPGDHPRSDLVDGTDRLAALRAGADRVDPVEPLTRDDIPAITEGHDPLGGEHERDWDRRYQVRFGRVTAEGIRPDGLEFAWPPGELYPEGGSADGEAEILDEGTELDRFGPAEGRVFAEAGTRFAQRSLPPAHLDQGYRRYRVLRPLPVWRAVSAAWFAQPGGGIRYRTTQSAIELVALGYLADVTREEP
ncbi:glycohydrolase toxin TNT-related protein [Actinophytocola sp. S1-96]|uniref:Glycohydrolase toxin TNT-related protein n=2 Tax=Actinophytocola gossypii TaxID=2812003 RepID=A0ABT2JEK3_9PSEU|nr:glycohydrolase toxin TNT-related protein [Actinophytocola gossypii]